MGEVLTSLYCKNLWVMCWFFWERKNEFFLSITLPKHTSSGKHTTCVRVGACVGVHHHSG